MSRRCLSVAASLLIAATAGHALAQNVPLATSAGERFSRLDVNHDGGLSKYEVDAEVVLHALDTDGDNLVSPSELAPLFGPDTTEATALDRVRVADRTADDRLDADELDRATQKRFTWMDANADGVLDQGELRDRFGVKMVGGE
jgi:hypothetical protein